MRAAHRRFPTWLKKKLPAGRTGGAVRDVLARFGLNTVCRSALCPNMSECFNRGTATFLIMGPSCTRSCGFCAVGKGAPAALRADEPRRVGEAAAALGLAHVVVTSVTRDDLGDGGAGHFAATIAEVRARTRAAVEVLVPDFSGSTESIKTVLAARPDVFNHNVETVPRLYPRIRPRADYRRSLGLLRRARELCPTLVTKSGLMLGLGEEMAEVEGVMADLLAAGCRVLTAGQYLAPSGGHVRVERFVEPGEFQWLEERAMAMGFEAARCAPFVRSSYRAEEVFVDQGLRRAGSEAAGPVHLETGHQGENAK